jgi:hypothetical protein
MFKITIESIFTLKDRGQIIVGSANDFHYLGKLKCGNLIVESIGYDMFPAKFDGEISLLIKGFQLTKDFIGKTFYQVLD